MAPEKPSPETQAFERSLSHPTPADYVLSLFVTGTGPRSTRAIQNIRAICDERLAGRYALEIVDIYQHPEKARPEQIVVAPTLIKRQPLPVRRLVGDLSDVARVLAGLGLPPLPVKLPEPC